MLSEDDRVALIRREPSGAAPYCPFPGGGIEAGETAGDAAIREAYEELGIQVRLKGLLAVVEFNGDTQHHFNASRATGTFGTGNGGEQAAPATSDTGSYTPVWMPLGEMHHHDVRPRALAALLAATTFRRRR